MTLQERIENKRVAKLFAEANKSDPFAYGRMKLHLDGGIEERSEVEKEAKRLLGIK